MTAANSFGPPPANYREGQTTMHAKGDNVDDETGRRFRYARDTKTTQEASVMEWGALLELAQLGADTTMQRVKQAGAMIATKKGWGVIDQQKLSSEDFAHVRAVGDCRALRQALRKTQSEHILLYKAMRPSEAPEDKTKSGSSPSGRRVGCKTAIATVAQRPPNIVAARLGAHKPGGQARAGSGSTGACAAHTHPARWPFEDANTHRFRPAVLPYLWRLCRRHAQCV